MGDIQFWFGEYEKEVEAFEELIDHLQETSRGKKPKAIAKSIAECEEKSIKLRDVKKSMGLELRQVTDKGVRAEYDSMIKSLDDKVTILSKDLKMVKTQQEKSELFQEKSGKMEFGTEGKGNDELLQDTNVIQDKTMESLARTRELIEASKEVGAATVDELRRQKEQIRDIEAEVDVIDSNLKRAERMLFNFARRMATDRIIQGFAALNIVVMLGLVLYIAISGKSLTAKLVSGGGPSSTSSPTTQPTTGTSRSPSYTAPPTARIVPTIHPTFRKIRGKPTFKPSAQSALVEE
jgi:hypothetical protein